MNYRIIVRITGTTPEGAQQAGRLIRGVLEPVFDDFGLRTLEEWMYREYHHLPPTPPAPARTAEMDHVYRDANPHRRRT